MSAQDRQRRLRALSLGDQSLLADRLEALGELPEPEILRGPETALVMVRGRIGGTGAPFNLGELLLTRCALRLNGAIGHGHRAGDEPEGAFLAALADALAQDPSMEAEIEDLVEDLEREIERTDAAEAERVEKTRVEFLTMTRGEDDD